MANKKPGRNDPCWYGSGRKYKKCHLPLERWATPSATTAVFRQLAEQRKAAQRRVERYGRVRPTIHMDFHGHKFVAVGSELHWSSEWKTFPDFLNDYLKNKLGTAWGNQQLRQDTTEQHPIIRLYQQMAVWQRTQQKDEDGIYRAIPTGPMLAWLALAYDLYVVGHHSVLARRLLRRLKNLEQYQGARYELCVAATFIRAGFEIDLEDEEEGTRRHPEFIARHQGSGEVVAVEAKSRHRPGVLGRKGAVNLEIEPEAGVRQLLEDAFAKSPLDKAYVVAIDVNLPAQSGLLLDLPWVRGLVDEVATREEAFPDEPEPFTMLLCTNHPFHYGGDSEPARANTTISVLARTPRVPFRSPGIALTIQDAAEQFARIPNQFEE